MNSEIPSILKLSHVTVGKADKQFEPRPSSGGKDEKDIQASLSLVPTDGLQVSNINTTEEKISDSKKAESKLSMDVVKKAVDEGNSILQVVKRNLQFKVDETTRELIVQVVDSDSGDLVRQIPSEEVLAFIERMQKLEGQQGLMIQDRA